MVYLQTDLAAILAMLAVTPNASVLAASKKGGKKASKKSRKKGKKGSTTLTLQITNVAARQPFAPFFVMSHDDNVPPLFTFGSEASEPLATLAETGSPAGLVEMYSAYLGTGVREVFGFTEGFPFFLGDVAYIDVTVSRDHPYVTIASMAIHTNDCFVAINGRNLQSGDVLELPGLDAGSEENNEMCSSMPGPACGDTGNTSDGDGEGYVHVHPGFFGIGDLAENLYDWRNPMAIVKVM